MLLTCHHLSVHRHCVIRLWYIVVQLKKVQNKAIKINDPQTQSFVVLIPFSKVNLVVAEIGGV